ncbi:MAG TPA: RluA family pseudouridine synthase [Treponemataceae bacterium]|nr:RluA family pseudouridine synthase [Treponemataceae bacterium]
MKKKPFYTTIYSDDDIVVVNKRSGLLVAGDRWDAEAPRLDKLVESEFDTVYAVHRIDKDTSGLVLYARNSNAHRALSLAFQNREVHKVYHALVYGRPLWDTLSVTLPLKIDGDDRHRTVVNKRLGKPSRTDFALLRIAGPFSWIECTLITGRTHQIRVHLAAHGLQIVCDPLYSGNQKPIKLSEIKRSWKGDPFEERPLLARLGLHAYLLEFKHPVTGALLSLTAPYQKDMNSLRKQLDKVFRLEPFI